MTAGLNKVILIGRIERAPEMRYTPSGIAVTVFGIAVESVTRTQDGNAQPTVELFSVVAWGELAERCKDELSGGMAVYVEGHLQTRSWVSDDQVRRYQVEVVAEAAKPWGAKVPPAPEQGQDVATPSGGDLPFA